MTAPAQLLSEIASDLDDIEAALAPLARAVFLVSQDADDTGRTQERGRAALVAILTACGGARARIAEGQP